LKKVPLVMPAIPCGTTPDWPSKSLEPQPQLPTLLTCARAAAGSRKIAALAMVANLFMQISLGKRLFVGGTANAFFACTPRTVKQTVLEVCTLLLSRSAHVARRQVQLDAETEVKDVGSLLRRSRHDVFAAPLVRAGREVHIRLRARGRRRACQEAIRGSWDIAHERALCWHDAAQEGRGNRCRRLWHAIHLDYSAAI